jgi:hypothetical protein
MFRCARAEHGSSLEDKRRSAEEVKAKAIEAARKLETEKAAAVKTLAKVPVSEGNAGGGQAILGSGTLRANLSAPLRFTDFIHINRDRGYFSVLKAPRLKSPSSCQQVLKTS